MKCNLLNLSSVEQHTVLLAGSIPPLRPAIHKHLTKPIAEVYTRNRHFSTLRGDGEATLTSYTLPPGAAYAVGAKGRTHIISNPDEDSTENILTGMGEGGIILTTEIEVDRGAMYSQRVEVGR
jgi:hypothetical protein